MPDNKKEQEREELHRAIWAIADDLRGSVDGWDFKSYVLGIMFYRYISENLTNYINADEIAAGNADFDYAKLSDEEAEQARDDLVQTKGFFIRQYLIDNNFIDCIIQLPGNLFFGTSIATCIMVLKKSKAENKTLFVDASKEFVKVTNNNKLTEDNIAKIVASFVDREDKDYFCRLVPNDEIAAQDYNLSVSTYVEQEDTREVINITELNAEIKRIVAREQVLRDEIDKIIAEIEAE